MKVLSFDPGMLIEVKRKKGSLFSSHFAYSFLIDGTVVQFGSITPIRTLKHPDYSAQAQDFIQRVRALYLSFDMDPTTDAVVIERFMDRGGARGTTGEFINQMIAMVAVAIYPMSLQQEPASRWKNWLAKAYQIGRPTKLRRCLILNMWLFLRERFPSVCWTTNHADRMTIHEADACAMALWRYELSEPKRLSGSIDNLISPTTRKVAA